MYNQEDFFNQPPKTRDCGYRCMYLVIKPDMSYSKFLEKYFPVNDPVKNGIFFSTIYGHLEYFGLDCVFTQVRGDGKFILWSTVWHRGGHYFVYDNGTIYDSLKSHPYNMHVNDLVKKVAFKNIKKDSFHALEIK